MKLRIPRNYLVFTLTILVIFFDQTSKSWARNTLIRGESISFIPGLLKLRLVKNPGAAFSLFSNWTPLLAIISLIVSIFLIIWLIQSPSITLWKGCSIGFLLGGTIGNGIDRWLQAGVTDFLQLVPIEFPIFNLADVSINLAILCFAINSIESNKMPIQK